MMLSPGLMVRSVARQHVSNHGVARMLQQRGRSILRDVEDAPNRADGNAPQNEAGREPLRGGGPVMIAVGVASADPERRR